MPYDKHDRFPTSNLFSCLSVPQQHPHLRTSKAIQEAKMDKETCMWNIFVEDLVNELSMQKGLYETKGQVLC